MNPMYARNINTSRYSCFLKRLCNDVVKHHLNKRDDPISVSSGSRSSNFSLTKIHYFRPRFRGSLYTITYVCRLDLGDAIVSKLWLFDKWRIHSLRDYTSGSLAHVYAYANLIRSKEHNGRKFVCLAANPLNFLIESQDTRYSHVCSTKNLINLMIDVSKNEEEWWSYKKDRNLHCGV